MESVSRCKRDGALIGTPSSSSARLAQAPSWGSAFRRSRSYFGPNPYRRGWDRQRILDLFAVLDWMMRLPEVLEQQLWHEIETLEGETKMPYVTSIERMAIQRGLKQGLEQGLEKGLEQGRQQGLHQGKLEGEAAVLERQLTKRFGSLSEEVRSRLHTASLEQLETWAECILDAPTLEAVFEDH
jgi:hypothetical protein